MTEEPGNKENNTVNNIIVFVDETPYGIAARKHAQRLASIFKTTVEEWREYDPFFKEKFLREAEEKNTILFVMGVAAKKGETLFHTKKAIQFIRDGRIPTMVVDDTQPRDFEYQKAIVSLDIDKQTKEKVMWASYFSRHWVKNGAEKDERFTIQLFSTFYKDEFLKNKTNDNLNFTKKIYESLEVDYELHSNTSTAPIDEIALDFARKNQCSPLVIMMTSFYSITDFLFGTRESKIIGKKHGVPILCINQRDDLYVLCT